MSSTTERRMRAKKQIGNKSKNAKKYGNNNLSIHSKLSYFLGILTIIIQFYLGFTHINDADLTGQYFGFMCILEGVFASVGVFLPDIIRGMGVKLYPKEEFRAITFRTLLVMAVGLMLNMLIQFISQIPLTIRDIEMALAIVFAAPAEELFFRAFLIEIFNRVSGEVEEDKLKKRTGIELLGVLLSGTAFGIFSMIFSSFMFALLHVNYYSDIRLMLIVFLGGFVYAILYWKYKDITGCILAHFLLNLYAVGQMFFLFNL